LALAAVCTANAVVATAQEEFEETLEVAEESVVVEPSWRPVAGDPIAEELVVTIGGRRQRVTDVQTLEGYRDWTIVIYVDVASSRPETLRRSLEVLQRAVDRLASYGRVSVLAGTPIPASS